MKKTSLVILLILLILPFSLGTNYTSDSKEQESTVLTFRGVDNEVIGTLTIYPDNHVKFIGTFEGMRDLFIYFLQDMNGKELINK